MKGSSREAIVARDSARPATQHSAGWRERLASWIFPEGGVAELRRQCEHHRAAAEGRWSDVYLMHAGPVDGGFEVAMRSPIGELLVEHMGRMLESVGAENWVAVDVFHRELGGLSLTVQRKRGKSPSDTIAELRGEIARLQMAKPIGSERSDEGNAPRDEQAPLTGPSDQ